MAAREKSPEGGASFGGDMGGVKKRRGTLDDPKRDFERRKRLFGEAPMPSVVAAPRPAQKALFPWEGPLRTTQRAARLLCLAALATLALPSIARAQRPNRHADAKAAASAPTAREAQAPGQAHAATVDTSRPDTARHPLPGEGLLTLRPARLSPGGIFEFDIALSGAQSPTLRLGKSTFRAFRVADGLFRGYGAVRVTTPPGQSPVTIEWQSAGQRHKAGVQVAIAPKKFPQRRLTVARQFTSPSPEQKARGRADKKAFAEAYSAAFEPPLFTQNFQNPVSDSARVTSVFGVRRVFNGKTKSRHMGLDLDGDTGTPIFAAADGVVRMRRGCFYAGNAVILSHGADLFTAYFHLSEFAVEEGERVRRGQLIGKMGMTGRVTGPHLHMEAKAGETSFDPASLLAFDFFPEGPSPSLAKVQSAAPTAHVAAQDDASDKATSGPTAPASTPAPPSAITASDRRDHTP